MFISNNLNAKSPTPRVPMTSSPRANIYHDIDFSDERKHKKKRRKKNRPPADFDGTVGGTVPIQNGQVPKALAPLPQKLKSVPPQDVHIRPSSALERPRENVSIRLETIQNTGLPIHVPWYEFHCSIAVLYWHACEHTMFPRRAFTDCL